MKLDNVKAIIGTIIHSVKFGELQVIENGAIIYNDVGTILNLYDVNKLPRLDSSEVSATDELPTLNDVPSDNIQDLSDLLIIPGFVDAHVHAPQYVFTGTGMDLPLLQWLDKYTFPCESRFKDDEFARLAYERSVSRHLKFGTTFASYFATIHLSAAKILVDVINKLGQRAFVGKVSMDQNSPDYYIEDTTQGCLEMEEFIRYVLSSTDTGKDFLSEVDSKVKLINDSPSVYERTLLNKHDTPLILPCVTPRFVPSCTGDMMTKLGVLAKTYGVPVQSHLSESPGEIEWVSKLYPKCETYAHVYDEFNLLHKYSYFAHCCHSGDREREVLYETQAGVVHCASSNFMLSSGIADIRRFIDEGIKVGLGTDVAGGFSPSMLDAIRQTSIASNCCFMEYRDGKRPPYSPTFRSVDSHQNEINCVQYEALNYKEIFHLATQGGAEVLGMGDVLGNFEIGKKLDCLVIDVNNSMSPVDVFGYETTLEKFQKFLFLGDDRNIRSVHVNGKRVL